MIFRGTSSSSYENLLRNFPWIPWLCGIPRVTRVSTHCLLTEMTKITINIFQGISVRTSEYQTESMLLDTIQIRCSVNNRGSYHCSWFIKGAILVNSCISKIYLRGISGILDFGYVDSCQSPGFKFYDDFGN